MKITIFTASSIRHKFLVNSLINHKIYLIKENKNSFSYIKSKYFTKTFKEKNYFKKVAESERKIFGNIKLKEKKISRILNVKYKKLSLVQLKKIKSFLKSDLYIVFGSSFIKNNLINLNGLKIL